MRLLFRFVVSGSVRSNNQGKDIQDPPFLAILNPIVMRTGTLESMLLLHRIDCTGPAVLLFFFFKYDILRTVAENKIVQTF